MAANFVLSLVDKVTGPSRAANAGIAAVTDNLKGLFAGGEKADAAMGALGGQFGDLLGTLMPTEGIMGQVVSMLSQLGPKGMAVAVALVVVTAAVSAVAAAIYGMASAAIRFSQEKDAMLATFDALAGGAEVAADIADMIDAMALELPFTGDKLAGWAKSLLAAGISADQLEGKITAIASATALMGESGGAAAEALMKRFAMAAEAGQQVKLDRRVLSQLAAAGVSATSLAAALGVPAEKLSSMSIAADKLGNAMEKALVDKGAGALQAMSLTWKTITDRFHDAIGDLFEDLGPAVRPFMAEVAALFAEFNAGGAIMGTTKGVVTSVLTSLFSLATKVVHALHYGFLVVEIAAFKVAIAIAPIVLWLRAVLSNAVVLRGLAIALAVLALPFVLLAVAIALAFAPLFILMAIFAAIAFAVGAVVTAVLWLLGVIYDFAASALSALGGWASGAISAAGDFISGLVSGIVSGGGAVIAAVGRLASSAVSSFKAALGISSPSKVMMRFGGYTAEGFASGMDAGTVRVQASARRMSGEAVGEIAMGARGPGAAGRGGRGAGGAMQVTFAPGSIVISGAGKSALEITEEMLAAVLERIAASQGLLGAPT